MDFNTVQGKPGAIEVELVSRDAKDTVHEHDGGDDDVGTRAPAGTQLFEDHIQDLNIRE